MISTADLSELLATLYAAPLQPEKWQEFFDLLSRLTKISSGYLIADGPAQREVLAGGGFSFNPEVLRLYNDYYGSVDPFAAPMLRNPRIAVIPSAELIRQDQLRKTEIYNDVLCKREMESMTLLSCSPTADETLCLSLWRRAADGPIEDEEGATKLLHLLLPHAYTALQLHSRLRAAEFPKLFSEAALDAMSIAAFLVNADGRVRHMNQLASAAVQNGDGLCMDGSILRAAGHAEDAQLRALIAGAALAGRKGAHAASGGALSLSRHRLGQVAGERSPYPLHVAVLPVPGADGTMAASPCALVFVSDPCAPSRSRAAFLRMLFRLTATESRLADLLLEGLEVRTIADRLGITLDTARFHLKRVLAKTGTNRQSELLRLMLSLPGQ